MFQLVTIHHGQPLFTGESEMFGGSNNVTTDNCSFLPFSGGQSELSGG